jgi:hypothetical protein
MLVDTVLRYGMLYYVFVPVVACRRCQSIQVEQSGHSLCIHSPTVWRLKYMGNCVESIRTITVSTTLNIVSI